MSASPPNPDAFPADISASRPTAPDSFHPEQAPVAEIEVPAQVVQDEPHEVNDYTGGASPMDIESVLQERSRQEAESADSPLGQGDDEGENHTVFSGPGSYTVRHSFSQHRSSFAARRRSNSSARSSFQGVRPQLRTRPSNTSSVVVFDDPDAPQPRPFRRGASHRDSRRGSVVSGADFAMDQDDASSEWNAERGREDEAGPSTTLGRLASFFGAGKHRDDDEESASRSRRTSMASSRRSGRGRSSSPAPSDSASENWGYTSHGDEDDADTYSNVSERSDGNSYSSSLADDTSLPPQSRPTSPTIPLLPSDGIFGDPVSHAHHDEPILDFAPCTSSSRQTIVLPDEDLTIRFTCYSSDPFRNALWWVACVLSFGILGLVGRWIPSVWVRWSGKETAFTDAKAGSWLVVETPYGDLHIVPLKVLPYPYPLSTVFPRAVAPSVANTANSSRAPSVMQTVLPVSHALSGEQPGGIGAAKDLVTKPAVGNGDVESGKTTWEETLGFLKVAEYRYTRFALNPASNQWVMIRDWRDPRWTSIRAVAGGLDTPTREQRKVLTGENMIDIEGKSVFGLLIDEVLHPFYVFQIASIVLWSIDDYYYYAFAIALISAASILSTLVETKRTIERMREMSRFHCDVRVLVDGHWTVMDCAELVPGDIFDASDPDLTIFPCDALLLSGDAIVNESMLTGESVPVSKIPVKDENLKIMSREEKNGSSEVDPDMAKHYMFCGTKIIRIRAAGGGAAGGKAEQSMALALVARTGFNTTKGALVRSMLFPKPMGFKFYRDSMNFIGVLTIIAGLGFAVSAVQFIRMGIKWHTILLRALDLITIVVPPALPATLTIGTTFAIERLRKAGIFCISPNRVNIGGKVNVVCFDKTGTLTEDGLDVLGVRTIDRHDERFSELHSEVQDVPSQGGANGKTPLLYALATCHALKLIEGEVIGDPLDIKMFEYTGWTLDEGQSKATPAASTSTGTPGAKAKAEARNSDRPATLVQTVVRPPGTEQWRLEDSLKSGGKHAHFLELGVIRTFDFVSALRRMSVIVKRLKSTSMEVYVKGAPEVMADICDPASFPKDYEDMLSYYTRNGFRVIAIAGKSIEGLTWLKAQRMKRDVAESNLQFLGFIVFENKLKEGTAPAIHTLRAAHLACRMVTGDNVRTAISVARECGLVSHSANVYIPSFVPGTGTKENAQLDWVSVDDEALRLDEYSLKPIVPAHLVMTLDGGENDFSDYQLAVTGDVFRWMLEYAALETVQRMLVKGVIFARMSPDEKAELIERLQALGYTVAFCGDGANDCGALKAADVGVSLSEAEASVAAPFTSRTPDIGCMIEVIREGRAALVTSFSCFKYMALYSLIQFTTVTLLYSFASSLGDFQFLYIDLFIIIPVAITMGRTLPYPKIHPKRPTASLVSKKVLTSIIGQIIINAAVQCFVFIWVRRQPWYTEPDVDNDKLETFNYENSALFLISSFQYILVAGVFSVGPPYRKPIYTNPSLILCLTGLGIFSTYVLLAPSPSIALILDLIDFTMAFKIELLVVAVVNIVACFAFERYAERPIARSVATFKRWLRGRKSSGRERKSHSGHLYKAVEGSMR